MIRLYDFEPSGECYKVRLLMAILELPFERRLVDVYPGGEHQTEQFLRINPLGQVPVLQDDELELRDSHAILAYLAKKYDKTGKWMPTGDAAMFGKVAMWLAFADAITRTVGAARLHDYFLVELDADASRADAHKLFRLLEETLWFGEQEELTWLCSRDHPTIADIACFPYVMLSEEGGISREDYPAIRRWTERVRRIPGFVAMPGVFPAAPSN